MVVDHQGKRGVAVAGQREALREVGVLEVQGAHVAGLEQKEVGREEWLVGLLSIVELEVLRMRWQQAFSNRGGRSFHSVNLRSNIVTPGLSTCNTDGSTIWFINIAWNKA